MATAEKNSGAPDQVRGDELAGLSDWSDTGGCLHSSPLTVPRTCGTMPINVTPTPVGSSDEGFADRAASALTLLPNRSKRPARSTETAVSAKAFGMHASPAGSLAVGIIPLSQERQRDEIGGPRSPVEQEN
ncbi:hypothetical protein NOVOSPHI9U_70088 [Novosphingobium sp. 9U]|nr:hypothetical protein NOVOSPHI9U_70088 [Novosphingobium sp. 9U]